MTYHQQAPWTRPEASAAARSGVAHQAPGDSLSFLFNDGPDRRRESRRITIGLVVLALVSVVLLNFVIYQSARRALVDQRAGQVARNTDVRRDQIRQVLLSEHRQARFVAEQPALMTAAARAIGGRLAPAELGALEQELTRAADRFKLHDLVLLSPEGVVLARARSASSPIGSHAEFAHRAAQSRELVVADIRVEPSGERMLEIAVPLNAAAEAGRVPVLLSVARMDDVLTPMLTGSGGWEAGTHAYLVREHRGRIVYLTPADPAAPTIGRTEMAATDPQARAGAMAAAGVESMLDGVNASGAPITSATRYLEELGWGLVVQDDRRAILSGMRATTTQLLVLNLLILVAIGASIWLWRRQFARGLARHEVEVTHRHAARVQAIFDTAFDAIVTFDRQGRVRAVNRAAEHLFGRAAAEMDGQPLHRLLHWGNQDDRGRGLPTPGVVCLAQVLSADGEQVPAEFSLGQAGEGDELLYTAIVRDIRDRVEAEQRIRAFAEGLEASNRRLEEVNAQLEEASRLKSEFLANTSHELRTPLNGMIGFLQLVLDGMAESPEEERDFLKQALSCSRHLLGLINDVLDIAKIESGKLTLDIERVDIETLFQEAQTVTHVQAAQRGIKLEFRAPEDPTHGARCDFAKAKQVLINLVGNSLKFTSRGSITVTARPHPDLGHVMFEVLDTGIGIPREQQHLIFEKFSQGDGSTTRKYGGTGLGLAISRSLVEVMGGVIGVQSEGMGKGTRMYFSLPLWNGEGTELPEAADPDRIDGPVGGALVLVVEDDPVFRKFLTALLHAHGYRTVEADHAEAGWVLVRRLSPALVITDYALSCAEGAHMRTGWDLAERMTTDAETRHIPVVFVTGFDFEVGEKLRATAFARKPVHLTKPVEGATLVAKIEELVGAVEGRQVRVLMADDDPAVGAFVRRVLPEQRFHIEVAANGEERLHILRTQPRGFDLLLLDLMMPGVSGYDVLREMTLTGTAAALPVMVLTNFPEARNADERRLLDQGLVLDVISKTSIHDNPKLLPHLLDWHLQVEREEPQDDAQAEAA